MSWLPKFKLVQLSRLAFHHVLDPLNRRHGASVFSKLRFPESVKGWYEPTDKWARVLYEARRDGAVFHEEEEYREDRASYLRRRGKGPPKKGQGKRQKKKAAAPPEKK